MDDPSTPSAREETRTRSDKFPCSMATIAVMILVTLAMGMRRWASFSYNNRPEATSNSAADRALTSGPGGEANAFVLTNRSGIRSKTTAKRIDVRCIHPPPQLVLCTHVYAGHVRL